MRQLRKEACIFPIIVKYCLAEEKDDDMELIINLISLVGIYRGNILCAIALSILIAKGTVKKFCKNDNAH